MIFGSLFAGIGGFDLGLSRAGATCAWQVEAGAFQSRVLAHHFPEVARYGDITTCCDLPAVDLVCGGFPCQDLSVAGRRAGLDGARSGLWWHFHRILESMRPTWVVIENVPGLLSSNGGRDMGAILGALGQLGYGWAYRVLDAQHFGVPQRRRRVFIVGRLGDGPRAAEILLEPEGGERNPAAGGEARTRVANCVTAPAGSGGWRGDADIRGVGVPAPVVTHALTQRCGKAQEDGTGRSAPLVAHTIRAEGHDASEDGTVRGVPLVAATIRSLSSRDSNAPGRRDDDDVNIVASTLQAPAGGTRSNRVEKTFVVNTLRGHPRPGSNSNGAIALGWQNSASQGDSVRDAVTPTLDKSKTPAVALPWSRTQVTHPDNRSRPEVGDPAPTLASTNVSMVGVRRLTPRECERLQGFPDDWTLIPGASDSARYHAIGNAVAVPVAEWIGRRILRFA